MNSRFETIRSFRPKDLAAILIAAVLYAAFSSAFLAFTQEIFFLNLAILLLILTFTLLLVNRSGTAIAICLLITLIHPYAQVVPFVTYFQHLAIMALVGFIFELSFLLLKLEIKSVPIDVVAGAAISASAIPWIIATFATPEWDPTIIIKIANISLINFLIGVISASAATFIWKLLQRKTLFLRFEYE